MSSTCPTWTLTAKGSGDRLATRPVGNWTLRGASPATLRVDPSRTFQTLLGFGGAFTEASAVNYAALGPANRARVLEAYFHPTRGHGYTMGRTHINSCDFALGNYACADVPA